MIKYLLPLLFVIVLSIGCTQVQERPPVLTAPIVQPTATTVPQVEPSPTPVPPTPTPANDEVEEAFIFPTSTPKPTQGASTPTEPPIEPEPTATPQPPAVPATSLELEMVATGFNFPLYLTHANDERVFVVEKAGVIWSMVNGVRHSAPFLDIADIVNDGANEQGLLSVAFHPNYAESGQFFVYYTDATDAAVIERYVVSDDPNSAERTSGTILLTVEQPYRNHNGGQLQFGPDGYLYIGFGDGGSGGDPLNHGQSPTTWLGSILRIDVDSAEPYAVPADNPFINDDGGANEVWAWGLRNPWRFSFDRATGDMWIADVGQNMWEEVSVYAADADGGLNFGWNIAEANACYREDCTGKDQTVGAIYAYDHSQGCSITGGYVYRGEAVSALYGNYVYADFCNGPIWAGAGGQTNLVLTTGYTISSFGEDASGELYVIDYFGTIYKIVGATGPQASAP